MIKRYLLTTAMLALAACSAQDTSGQKPVTTEKITTTRSILIDYTFTPEQQVFIDAAGWTGFDPGIIRTQKLKDGLAVIFGYGGNILVSTGDDGVLIVDSQFPQIYAPLMEQIRALGGQTVDYIINTHWHFDHAEGNRAFGPLGAEIIAHENSRQYMGGSHDVNLVQVVYPQQPYEKAAIPKISFTETMNMSLNGNDIELYHFGPAHTTGDTFVYFRTSNVVHMGDVANLSGFPFIDADNGGTLDGMILSVREMLEIIDDDTIVVPGHGEVADKTALVEYVTALETVRERIMALKMQGRSLEEIQAEDVAGEFFGPAGPMLVDRAFASMN